MYNKPISWGMKYDTLSTLTSAPSISNIIDILMARVSIEQIIIILNNFKKYFSNWFFNLRA